jgi:hypothetical protein
LLGQFIDGIALIEALFPEILVVPGIFANGERDRVGTEVEEVLPVGGAEVALLVEDVVIGQQHFALAEMDVAALEDDGGVPDALAIVSFDGFDGAANDGDAERGGGGGEFLNFEFGLFEEGGAIEEVLRRVADESEFGEDDDVGAGFGANFGGCFIDAGLVTARDD